MTHTGFKYLGIDITYQLEDLVKMNLIPIIKQIKLDLTRWMELPISFLGRISIIKMNILPRMLYPIQMIPNIIPSCLFKDLHRTITNFIWKNQRPKMKLEKLQLPVEKGGLAVPNFQYYHWAIVVDNLSEWIEQDPNSTWLDLVLQGCTSATLPSIPFIKEVRTLGIEDNFIVNNVLSIWKKY